MINQIESNEEQPETFVKLRAVEYVRMSTEHQQYSTENQSDKIREYAARHDIEIVRTYTDAGKSGLRIDGRASAVRLDETNHAALDYYLLPRLDFDQPRIRLAEHNPIEFESYRFDSLDYLYGMAEHTRLRRAA